MPFHLLFNKCSIGIPKISQPASCKGICESQPYLFNQMDDSNPHNLKCCIQNKDCFISSNRTTLPKNDFKSDDTELKLIHMAASLGLTRYRYTTYKICFWIFVKVIDMFVYEILSYTFAHFIFCMFSRSFLLSWTT